MSRHARARARMPAVSERWSLRWSDLAMMVLAGGVGFGLGQLATVLDDVLPALELPVSAIRGLLTTVLSGVITAAIFAIWMRTVVGGLLAGQVSPRLLVGHLDDRYQLRVLTVLIGATGLVAAPLVGLPANGNVASTISLPLVLLTAAGAITAVFVTLNRAVRDLSVQELVFQLTNRGLNLARERGALMGGPADRPAGEGSPRSEDTGAEGPRPDDDIVRADTLGWVVDIDRERLLDALPEGVTAHLTVRPGHLLSPGEELVHASERLDDDQRDEVLGSMQLDRHRLLKDDLDYLIGQMVDAACGSLAEGSVDTATAHDAICGLGLVMSELACVEDRAPVLVRDDGRRLVDEAMLGVRHLMWDPLERLRAAVVGHPAATRQLLDAFARIADTARDAGRQDVVDDVCTHTDVLIEHTVRASMSGSVTEDLVAHAERRGLGSWSDARTGAQPERAGRGGDGDRDDPHEGWTKDELYDRAQELDVDGRSQMSKSELLDTLRRS